MTKANDAKTVPRDGKGTAYVILQRKEAEGEVAWVAVTDVIARSRLHAVRVYTGDGEDAIEGTFKAVPLGSWRGSVVTAKVTTASRKVID